MTGKSASQLTCRGGCEFPVMELEVRIIYGYALFHVLVEDQGLHSQNIQKLKAALNAVSTL